jgi:hypothetical protein
MVYWKKNMKESCRVFTAFKALFLNKKRIIYLERLLYDKLAGILIIPDSTELLRIYE